MSKPRLHWPLAGLAIAACSQPEASEPRYSAPVLRVGGVEAARVNGEPIYRSDVELEAAAQGLIEAGEPFRPDHPDYQTVLDQLVDQRLLAQEAIQRALHETPGALHRLAAARERILGNILVESLVAAEVDEAAIQEMYAEQVRLQQLDDEVRIRHILFETEEAATAVREEILAGGDFSALAFEHSRDASTRLEGGELGYVSPNAMDEPFASQIANTAVGGISSAFESDQGWHVIKVEDRRQKAPQTLEEMRPEIVTFLTYAEISRILRRLRADATISQADDAPSPDAEPAGAVDGGL